MFVKVYFLDFIQLSYNFLNLIKGWIVYLFMNLVVPNLNYQLMNLKEDNK